MDQGFTGDVIMHIPGIEEPVIISLQRVKGRRSAMVGIQADKSIVIERREVMERRVNSLAKIAKAATLGGLDGEA